MCGHIWERHPAGDEMLCVLEGRIVLTLMDEDGAEADVLLDARRSAVVPRGVWHRLHVACPGKILFVTPGQGSEHRRGGRRLMSIATATQRAPGAHLFR